MPMFPSLTFLVLLYVSAAQMDSLPGLYVVENVKSDRGVETQNLVRVSMDRENKLVRETLLSKDGRFFSTSAAIASLWGGSSSPNTAGLLTFRPRK
jgi:hypothetical protein